MGTALPLAGCGQEPLGGVRGSLLGSRCVHTAGSRQGAEGRRGRILRGTRTEAGSVNDSTLRISIHLVIREKVNVHYIAGRFWGRGLRAMSHPSSCSPGADWSREGFTEDFW